MTQQAQVPLALGQRIVAILETGVRTATYRLATLTALIDHCIALGITESSSPARCCATCAIHPVMRARFRPQVVSPAVYPPVRT